MLYTRKGDDGTTKFFDAKAGERASKKSLRAEALGTVDEINSLVGVLKVKSFTQNFSIQSTNEKVGDILGNIQQTLFIVQAELAGAEKTVSEEKVKYIEEKTDAMEKEMPPITSFFVSGGTELGAFFDVARTIARRAERRVVAAVEADEVTLGEQTRKFLNRLSSVLYACARYANFRAGIREEAPRYE
jgi:cob(I)alamin adenosyltransferase